MNLWWQLSAVCDFSKTAQQIFFENPCMTARDREHTRQQSREKSAGRESAAANVFKSFVLNLKTTTTTHKEQSHHGTAALSL